MVLLKNLRRMSTAEWAVLLFVFGYILTFLVFYPPFYTSSDDHEYLYNSYLLQKGSILVEDKTLTPFGNYNGEGYVSAYFIGRSIFLIPFTWFGWNAAFLSGLVLHLINLYIFHLILKRLDMGIENVLLYLFYPTFFWNSRTLGSELLVLTCILVAFYYYMSEHKIDYVISGLFFGFACLARYEALLIFLSFATISLIEDRKKLKYMCAGFAPVAFLILLFNKTYYGGWLGTGYSVTAALIEGRANTPIMFLPGLQEYLPRNLLRYLVILSISYPLMSLAPFFYKGKFKKEIQLSIVAYLLAYSNLLNISAYTFLSPVTITGRIRYLIPVLGFFLITYIPFYKSVLEKLRIPKKPIFLAAILILFTGSVYMSYIHADFLGGRRGVFEQIYANTGEGSLIIGSADDGIYVMPGVFGDRKYIGLAGGKYLGVSEDYIESRIDSNTYVIYLRYKTQIKEIGKKDERQLGIDWERQKAEEFIKKNGERIILIYTTSEPHFLDIYRFREG